MTLPDFSVGGSQEIATWENRGSTPVMMGGPGTEERMGQLCLRNTVTLDIQSRLIYPTLVLVYTETSFIQH